MTYFSASATPSGITHHLSVTALGLGAKHVTKSIVPYSGWFYSWTLRPITRQTSGLSVVYDLQHGPDSRANHDRAGRGDPRGRALAGRRHRPLSAPDGRTQQPGRRVLHDYRRICR